MVVLQIRSKFEAVVLAPLLHDLDDVFAVRVARVLEHLDDFEEAFFALLLGDDHLEYTDCGTTLSFPEFRVGIEALKDIESFDGVVELSHLVAIVGDQVEQGETLVGRFHVDVNFPGEVRLLVHNVATAEPRQVAVVSLVLLICDRKEALFSVLVFTSCRRGDTEVPVEVIVTHKVRSNTLQVNKHVIELFQDEEARGHALAAWYRVALRWRCSDHLEKVLCNTHVVFLVLSLADDSMDYSLEDVLLWQNAVHILDQVVGLVHLLVLEIVDH